MTSQRQRWSRDIAFTLQRQADRDCVVNAEALRISDPHFGHRTVG